MAQNYNEKHFEMFRESYNEMTLAEKIMLHNNYVDESGYGDRIEENDKYFINENFSTPWDAILSADGTGYRTCDEYAWIDDLGNLYSADFEGELPLAEIDDLYDFYSEDGLSYLKDIRSMEEFYDAIYYGDDEEEDEDDEEDENI